MTYPFVAGKRSEVAHAQYSAQLRQSRTDPLACAQTMVCSFLLDELLTSESGLSLFLSLWSRLRSDCSEIYHWLKNPVQTVSLFLCCQSRLSLTNDPRKLLRLYYASLRIKLPFMCRWRMRLTCTLPELIHHITQVTVKRPDRLSSHHTLASPSSYIPYVPSN